jgi:signal transduction histidine kinase
VDDSSTKIEQMKKIEHTLLEDMEQKARELRSASEREAIISGALILLVLGVSLVGAFVIARSMIRSLRRLQETANKVAQDRLPELVKQLSESDPQDVDTSVESVGVHSRDEIGQVAAAFDDVHREAVRLAAEQALLRGNVNAMFTNLSRRSQGLIQRQLSLISELESREADPDQLSSLFKLDHLATRMRRNGENLLVLAGEEPGRRWTRPVPLVDVLRAAASEVEQYERIELSSVPTTEVAGRVVNDLVHLLAELLENATSFSSPQTKVKVTGHALPDGRVLIEIHDTGIGLSPEDLAAINERLASPPTVDVSVSRRMGLFVVGRLSQRHGIRIQLRPSDSGGTTALVMLPVDVAQGGKKPAPGKPGQAAVGAAAAAPRPVPVRPAGATARVAPRSARVRPPVATVDFSVPGPLRAARSVPVRARGPRCPVRAVDVRVDPAVPVVRAVRVDLRVPRRRRAVRPVRVPVQVPVSSARRRVPRRVCRPPVRVRRRASVTVVRTPSAVCRRRTTTRCRRSARATTSPSRPAVVAGDAGVSRSSRRAVVRGPSCPAATATSAPAGATRTRSPRWAAATSTPRAVTTSGTPSRPPGCRASTTARAPRPRRRCRRYRASTPRTAGSSRVPVPTERRTRASSRVPAPTGRRTPGSSPGRAPTGPRTAGSSPARARAGRRTRASSPAPV